MTTRKDPKCWNAKGERIAHPHDFPTPDQMRSGFETYDMRAQFAPLLNEEGAGALLVEMIENFDGGNHFSVKARAQEPSIHGSDPLPEGTTVSTEYHRLLIDNDKPCGFVVKGEVVLRNGESVFDLHPPEGMEFLSPSQTSGFSFDAWIVSPSMVRYEIYNLNGMAGEITRSYERNGEPIGICVDLAC